MKNLDPNALTLMSEEQRSRTIDLLHALHQDLVQDGNAHPDTLCGLEFVLQALGAEGYEWS